MCCKVLSLFTLISQRLIIEIISFTIFLYDDSRIPNFLFSSVTFTGLNLASMLTLMIAYVMSLRIIIVNGNENNNI